MSSEKYHYEPGAIHHDHHKEINIGSVSERALKDIMSSFFKDDAEDAEFEEMEANGNKSEDSNEADSIKHSMADAGSPFNELIDKGDWQLPATTENIKAMMATALKDTLMQRMLNNGRGDRVRIVWQNLIGYFADRKLLPCTIGSPALNQMFFGNQEGYSNIDKGRPSRDTMSADFRDLVSLLDKLVPQETDKKN